MSFTRSRPAVAPDLQGEGPGSVPPPDLPDLVREALARERLRLEFQPVVAAAAPSEVGFHEGFIRILDGQGRLIPAARFMSAMEQSPLGRELDCAALRMGLLALQSHPGLRLSINASARSIGNADWRNLLVERLDGVARRLLIEFKEASTVLLPDRVARFVAEMRPTGLRFVLDDFGAGPLSLRQLRDLRFDGVKIDGEFVRRIDARPESQALVGALASVAHRFGMFAAAKGVETAAEASELRALGLDHLQGFHFGRPRFAP
jgi:EAL domain-containing protein (putative c-di-GMP-specific phosphodiesterase class I)